MSRGMRTTTRKSFAPDTSPFLIKISTLGLLGSTFISGARDPPFLSLCAPSVTDRRVCVAWQMVDDLWGWLCADDVADILSSLVD